MTGPEEPTEAAPESPSHRNGELTSIVESVRRLTIAVWCLTGLLAISNAVPWAMFLFGMRATTSQTFSAASHAAAAASPPSLEFDNDFHARPPDEKIKRATVILVTVIDREPGKHKEVISEIVKSAPGVRFYYKVGDEFSMLSHVPTPDCEGCEGDGQVVFLLGNPAEMASSYSYEHGRIQGMGGLSLAELRQLAQKSLQPAQ